MPNSGQPINLGPLGLKQLMEGQYVWLLLALTLAMDVATSMVFGTPLVRLTSDQLDKLAPVGALSLYISAFALWLLFMWKIRYWFFLLTAPLARLFDARKTAEDFKRHYAELQRSCVPDYTLLGYIIKNDHKALHSVLQEFRVKQESNRLQLILIFTAGVLLATVPWLPTSSWHTLIFARFSISPYWALLPASMLMMVGTHSEADMQGWVYVGADAAKMICPPLK